MNTFDNSASRAPNNGVNDEKLRKALRALWVREFDPQILQLRHTPGNLVKIERTLIDLLGCLSETRLEIISNWERDCRYIEESEYRDQANDAFREISESEHSKFEASIYSSPLYLLIERYINSLKKRQRKHLDSGKDSNFAASYALTLGILVLRELKSITTTCRNHDKLALLQKVHEKPVRS